MKRLVISVLFVAFSLLLTACGGGETSPATESIAPPLPTTPPLPPTPIVHTMIPGEPVFLLAQLISDCTIGNGVTVTIPITLSPGCDRWDYNKIERPFEGSFVKYSPQEDIARAQIGYDETWFFAQAITYAGEIVDPQPMNSTYGIELDLNIRIEFLKFGNDNLKCLLRHRIAVHTVDG